MQHLLFMIFNPGRVWEAIKLSAEITRLECCRMHLSDVSEHYGAPSTVEADLKAEINIIKLRIALLLDPSVEIPKKENQRGS